MFRYGLYQGDYGEVYLVGTGEFGGMCVSTGYVEGQLVGAGECGGKSSNVLAMESDRRLALVNVAVWAVSN